MPWKHCGSIVVIILCFTVSIALAEHPDHLIAIDVLLKPDSPMEARAKQWNAVLHEQSPEAFQDFEFGIEEMAVYQLGNFGTAVKRLDVKVSASGQ
ncbi:hypothetical protein [uncultured Endozoicomonas sp.]|uniref:hypothetical protein n=1 Tax=uncultured Endozoicomonas sp. TaxID=432652 RepID=UPI00261D35D2|nr:hypothetical protein [uncultured Endozoicomonas sp.]